MEFQELKERATERVKVDKRECNPADRIRIIERITNASTPKDIAFTLLDYNLPLLFAELFRPNEETKQYIKNWGTREVDLVSDQQINMAIRALSESVFSFLQSPMPTDIDTSSNDDLSRLILQNIYKDEPEKLNTIQDGKYFDALVEYLSKPGERAMAVGDLLLKLVQDRVVDVTDKIVAAWSGKST